MATARTSRNGMTSPDVTVSDSRDGKAERVPTVRAGTSVTLRRLTLWTCDQWGECSIRPPKKASVDGPDVRRNSGKVTCSNQHGKAMA